MAGVEGREPALQTAVAADASGAAWARLRRLRQRSWLGLAVLAIGGIALVTEHRAVGYAIGAGALALLALGHAERLRCPNCGRPFGRRWIVHNHFATRCLTCGIRMGETRTATTNPPGIPTLQEDIRRSCGCEARWLKTVLAQRTDQGRLIWQGEVQVFDLVDHPKARRAYVWRRDTESGRGRFHVVLGIPPVDDAQAAIGAEQATDARA